MEILMLLKVLMLGDGAVGKTTLIDKLRDPTETYNGKMTIFFDAQRIKLPNTHHEIVVFDFGGQIQFRDLIKVTTTLFNKSDAIFLCFDLSRFSTFKNVKVWHQLIKSLKLPTFLIGMKADKPIQVPEGIIQDYCKENKLEKYFATSALKGTNLQEIFKAVIFTQVNEGANEIRKQIEVTSMT